MKTSLPILLLALGLLCGCETPTKKDYTAFQQHQPKSILVLPPLNESTDILAGYSMLTTTVAPLSELGYYVFPVAMVDRYLKENGLPTAAEMHAAPLDKLHEVFGADAVLYITVEKYGSKYQVIASQTFAFARARLVDSATGTVLWEDRVQYAYSGQSGLIEAVVDQVVNKLVDQAHNIGAQANIMLLMNKNSGLLIGARHPQFGKPPGAQ